MSAGAKFAILLFALFNVGCVVLDIATANYLLSVLNGFVGVVSLLTALFVYDTATS